MNVYDNDIEFVAEYLASLSWVLRLALEHPANVCGNEVAPAAFVLCRLMEEFAERLSEEETTRCTKKSTTEQLQGT